MGDYEASERPRWRGDNAKECWLKNAPRAAYSGLLDLAGYSIVCAVLEDGRRVLSTVSFTQAIGRTGKIQTATMPEDGISFKAPPFLLADNLKPFVDKHLESPQATPISHSRPRPIMNILLELTRKFKTVEAGASMEVLEADEPETPDIPIVDSSIPIAKYRGLLDFGDLGAMEIPCYVLEGGQRVIGRTSRLFPGKRSDCRADLNWRAKPPPIRKSIGCMSER